MSSEKMVMAFNKALQGSHAPIAAGVGSIQRTSTGLPRGLVKNASVSSVVAAEAVAAGMQRTRTGLPGGSVKFAAGTSAGGGPADDEGAGRAVSAVGGARPKTSDVGNFTQSLGIRTPHPD